MSMLAAYLATVGSPNPITVNSNWGSDSGFGFTGSPARTLTVPAGNPGTIRFGINSSSGGDQSYLKNGGGSTLFSDGTTMSVASADTLQLVYAGDPGDSASFTVYDNTTNTVVGTWSASIS